MRKLLIGPLLTGAGWMAGSYYGASIEQVVRKSPESTYDGVSQALERIPQSGTTAFEGGQPMPYAVEVDRTPGKRLLVRLKFDGRQAAETELLFHPQNGGNETLVTASVHKDRAVLTHALAGTSRARLAYAPDWMLNLLTVRPLLQQVGEKIERGEMAEIFGGSAQAEWEASLPPEQQREVQEWRQYSASKPTVDPGADAERYLNGGQQ